MTTEALLQLARPSYSDAIWQVDIMRLSELFSDEEGQIVFIRDTYSGRCLGLAFGDAKTRKLIKLALRHAISNTGFIPFSMRYDGGLDNTSSEMRDMMNKLCKDYFKHAPYRPTGKGSIEQFIDQVKLIITAFDNFAGGRIVRHGIDNPDVVKALELPTSEQTMIQLWAAVEIVNNRTDGTGISPSKKYVRGGLENVRKTTFNKLKKLNLI